MKTNQIRTYTAENTCSYGIRGWYYTENKNPIPEVEWRRWVD